jgi:hypothetical protein
MPMFWKNIFRAEVTRLESNMGKGSGPIGRLQGGYKGGTK